MKKVLLATVAVLGFVGAASAADLRPLPGPTGRRARVQLDELLSRRLSRRRLGRRKRTRPGRQRRYFPPSGAWSYDTKSKLPGGGTLGV